MLGGRSTNGPSTRRVDYLKEAMALERQGDFEAALTSYRLAQRDHPQDASILVNIAIAYSKTGRLEDAIRSYRRALDLAPQQSGAHYGLSFLLLKRGDHAGATTHLQAFLSATPADGEMSQWVQHAEQTLAKLRGDAPGESTPTAEPQ
ncbi:MAG: tetratricopeptide repeat protein [Gemmatimonadota bacterium]